MNLTGSIPLYAAKLARLLPGGREAEKREAARLRTRSLEEAHRALLRERAAGTGRDARIAVFDRRPAGGVCCPCCWTTQPADRAFCCGCGAKFVFRSEGAHDALGSVLREKRCN